MRLSPIALASLTLTGVLATACGGGGGGSSSTGGTGTPAQNPVSVVISGTAATGAAFNDAVVQIIDKTGTVVGNGTTGADGSFTVTLSANAQAPFVIQAVRDDETLVSVAADTSATTVNITPITTLIAARLSTSGDPAKLAAELQANPELITPTTVNAKVAEVVAVLKPLLDAVGTTLNPLTGAFAADGSGMDRVLDSVAIKITPDSATTSNIEIVVKQALSEDAQPTVVKFTSTAATVEPLPAIPANTLVENGTATLIADLLKRMTSCYALPAADRVVTVGATNAEGDQVKADACKDLFINDDPTAYRHNGARVGSAQSRPFSSLWRAGALNTVFDRGAYEFTRANGDVVISYRVVGTAELQPGVVRKSDDGKLRFVGNQYLYPGEVAPYHQLRTFAMQPSASHYSTGYTLNVPNNGMFSKVVVTSPRGREMSLFPSAGSSFLVFRKDGVATSTNFVRLRGEFVDSSTTGNPATYESSLIYASTQDTNEQIAAYAPNGTWKFDYYLTANSSGTPDATQYFRTLNRALNIPEIKSRGLAVLSQADLTQMKSEIVNGSIPLTTADDAIELSWEVPAGALPPGMIRIFGRGPGPFASAIRYEDSQSVPLTARTGRIACQPASLSDNHCTMVNGSPVFSNGSLITGLDFVASDERKRAFSHFYATYSLISN